jgi:hypothetical protein
MSLGSAFEAPSVSSESSLFHFFAGRERLIMLYQMSTSGEESLKTHFAEPFVFVEALRFAMVLRSFGSRGSLGSVRRFS